MKYSKRLLLSLILLLTFASPCFAVTEMISVINKSGEDYNTFTLWEAAFDDAGDITDGTVKCGSWDAKTGSIPVDTTALDWDGGASTGTLIHASESNGGSGGDQYCIDVTGGSLADNDVILDVATSTDGFTIAGTPDSCIFTAEFYDDDGDLSDEVVIDGSTTDSTNFLKITVPSAERHNGTDNNAATIISAVTGTGSKVVSVLDNYTIVEWLIGIIDFVDDTRHEDAAVLGCNNVFCTFRYNVVHAENVSNLDAFSDDNHGILMNDGTSGANDMEVYDNIVYGFDHSTDTFKGITVNIENFRDCSMYIYNNTAVLNDIGIKSTCSGTSGTSLVNARNNVASGNSINDFDLSLTNCDTFTADYNCSEDTTAAGGNSSNDCDDSTDFESSTDFHLVTGAEPIDIGVDLGTTPSGVEIDIDNRDRDAEGDTWDMGAHEFVAATVTFKPYSMIY